MGTRRLRIALADDPACRGEQVDADPRSGQLLDASARCGYQHAAASGRARRRHVRTDIADDDAVLGPHAELSSSLKYQPGPRFAAVAAVLRRVRADGPGVEGAEQSAYLLIYLLGLARRDQPSAD